MAPLSCETFTQQLATFGIAGNNPVTKYPSILHAAVKATRNIDGLTIPQPTLAMAPKGYQNEPQYELVHRLGSQMVHLYFEVICGTGLVIAHCLLGFRHCFRIQLSL
ncbi:hypothetical protein CA13_30730 [Planctomycetes bacterium CA13]|uniref:Uncharacterized protein n=1 Tax=Novipirellula herctigrandis TaxID=2527986 RepID=A0A5C5Z374_9BACT|nr:hypothetical protein CA13_30730 [Planctomycetes bacterium CA13]